MLGQFELLVKRYDGGAVSQYLHSLEPGNASVQFKHIKFNVKAPYPFEGRKLHYAVRGQRHHSCVPGAAQADEDTGQRP